MRITGSLLVDVTCEAKNVSGNPCHLLSLSTDWQAPGRGEG